jgi:hypothetical protein
VGKLVAGTGILQLESLIGLCAAACAVFRDNSLDDDPVIRNRIGEVIPKAVEKRIRKP